ncbi:hypothetical protein V6N13_043514 [Hibiscus sabdariffa]|uniref:Uncharacterized protein n=1 Tax=Hibiscus sabdariffa TaxID=183260 RepID=A0ABR2G2D1_9ROSI
MEKIEDKYHGKAVESGSLIGSACGFDSIPSEMGVMFNTRQWEVPSVPNHVTAYELRRSRPKKPRPVDGDGYCAFSRYLRIQWCPCSV